MRPMVVVEEYRFLNNLAYLPDVVVVTVKIELRFYRAVDPFRYRILVRVTWGGHTDLNTIAL